MLDSVDFKIGDETFKVRPVFPALEAISLKYDGVFGAMERTGRMDAAAIVDVVCILLEANGIKKKKADVGEALMASGLNSIIPMITKVLVNAIQAGPEVPADLGDAKSGEGT
jgi:hypothetical protein